MKRLPAFVAVPVLGLLAVACTSTPNNPNSQHAVVNNDQRTSAAILGNFERNQPVTVRPWSQLRQNLNEIEAAQMDTTQTTSFFFNQGVQEPLQSCPSIGFPIASTSQLTNPDQKVIEGSNGGDHGNVTLPQIDPNGIYAGPSTGTYVMCVTAEGKPYAVYWEGFVQTVTGVAKWNGHGVDLVGEPSFAFTAHK